MLRIIVYLCAALVALAAIAYAGWWVWQIASALWQARKYAKLTDTHDLVARIDRAAERFCARRNEVSLVVGVTQRGERYVKGFRSPGAAKAVLPDGKTVFEIGSITKVFTCIVLARFEPDGLVALDDTIAEYLPRDLGLAPEVAAITLRQLATHTSGLPRNAPSFMELAIADVHTCYAKHTRQDLYESLRTVKKLEHKPGTRWLYSTFGLGLLGHILELKSGKPYETLVQETVCGPLDLKDTTVTLSQEQQARMARGYTEDGNPVPTWEFDVLAPAGALRSTADDLLTFAEANLTVTDSALSKAMHRARQQHFAHWWDGASGLGWMKLVSLEDIDVWWHDGGTGAYSTFLGFSEKHQLAVVVLSGYGNALYDDDSLDKVGFELLKLATKVSLR